MNYSFFPDLFALTILIVILLLVRRSHPGPNSSAWLLGLFFTLLEEVVHTFYPLYGPPSRFLHVTVVDSYAIAGMLFIWGAGNLELPPKSRMLFLSLNGLPLLALGTFYGLNIRVPHLYIPIVVAGIVIGAASSFWLRRNVFYALLYTVGWIAVEALVHRSMFRQAVYWAIACVYALAAFKFERRLEGNTTGKLAIVPGFAMWSLCFLFHPWAVSHVFYADIASHVTNMQNCLVSIGMILVLLEEQVSANQWLALHDELTGLPNRRMFASRLNLAIERCNREKSGLALVILDLDGFKKINDTLGHLAGDHVLREVATTLRGSVRSTDIVARLGGDEFIIMAADMTNEKSVQRFVDTIGASIERPLLFNDQPIRVTASLGIAMYPGDADDAIKLLRLADQRMYFLKKRPMQPTQIETSLSAISPPA